MKKSRLTYLSKKIRKGAFVLCLATTIGSSNVTSQAAQIADINVEYASKKVSKSEWKSYNDKLEYRVLNDGSYVFRKHNYDKKYNKKTKKDTYKCKECGYKHTEKHTHDFTKWKYNENKKRYERKCSDCEIKEAKTHKNSKTIKVYDKHGKYIKTINKEKEKVKTKEKTSNSSSSSSSNSNNNSMSGIIYVPNTDRITNIYDNIGKNQNTDTMTLPDSKPTVEPTPIPTHEHNYNVVVNTEYEQIANNDTNHTKVVTKKCVDDDATIEERTEVAHSYGDTVWGEWTDDPENANQEIRTGTQTCSDCGYVKTITETREKQVQHTHNYTDEVSTTYEQITNNDTNHTKVVTKKCVDDDATTEERTEVAHTYGDTVWGEWTDNPENENQEKRTETQTCSDCGYIKTRTETRTKETTQTVTNVTINNAPEEELFVNSTGTLTATVSPNNAIDNNVTWSSSNPNYVSINETTGEYEVKGTNGYGSATITATAGGKTATCTITGKVTYTSLKAGDVLHVGDTFYVGKVYFDTTPAMSFQDSNGVITLVENNGYYKFKRGSNGSMPNVTAYKIKDNTDGIYIVSGSGTSTNDKFTLAVHTITQTLGMAPRRTLQQATPMQEVTTYESVDNDVHNKIVKNAETEEIISSEEERHHYNEPLEYDYTDWIINDENTEETRTAEITCDDCGHTMTITETKNVEEIEEQQENTNDITNEELEQNIIGININYLKYLKYSLQEIIQTKEENNKVYTYTNS